MKISSFVRLLALSLVLVFVSSSCLDVTYETTINKDGSGSQTMSMDFAKIMTSPLGPDVLGVEEVDPEAFEKELNLKVNGALDSLPFFMNLIEGIEDYEIGVEEYELASSFDFDNVQSISSSAYEELNIFTSDMKLVQEGKKSTLSWKINTAKLGESFFDNEIDKSEEIAMLRMVDNMVGGGVFAFRFNLPGKIKAVSNEEQMVVSGDKRSVTVNVDIYEVLEGKAPGEYFVTYK